MAGLTAPSKKFIADAVAQKPSITYNLLVSGEGLKDYSVGNRSLIRLDPAFCNRDLVERHMTRIRRSLGVVSRSSELESEILDAIRALGSTSYIFSGPKLVHGPMSTVIYATDEQLFFLCSKKMITGQVHLLFIGPTLQQCNVDSTIIVIVHHTACPTAM